MSSLRLARRAALILALASGLLLSVSIIERNWLQLSVTALMGVTNLLQVHVLGMHIRRLERERLERWGIVPIVVQGRTGRARRRFG